MSETVVEAAWFSLEGEDFVRHAYQRVLGRPADPAGLKMYVERLTTGLSKADLVADLENSPEGRLVARRRAQQLPRPAASVTAALVAPASVQELLRCEGEDFVRSAYVALLGREADPAGLRHYCERLATGESREQIVADLHSDPEGQAYGARLSGLPELFARLGERPQEEIVQVNEASELLKLHGSSFVRAAYRAVLGREADAEGLAHYSGELRNGYSRSFVLAALASSEEARSKGNSLPGLAELVSAYAKGQRASWSGWYWRNVKGAESDLPSAREVRRTNLPAEKP